MRKHEIHIVVFNTLTTANNEQLGTARPRLNVNSQLHTEIESVRHEKAN